MKQASLGQVGDNAARKMLLDLHKDKISRDLMR